MTKSEIARIKKFFNKKNTLPVLDKCLVNDGKITVSDLEYSGQFLTDVKGSGLIDISELERPYDEAWIKDGLLHVKRGTSVSTSVALETEEYPIIPFDPKTENADGKEYFFHNSEVEKLRKLQPFLGKDQLRPAMSGFGIINEKFYSTDAHMLGWEDFSEKTLMPDVILPGKSSILLADKDYDLYLHVENEIKRLIFHSTDGTEKLSLRPTEGRYPDAPGIIPLFNPLTVKIDTAILLNEIENALKASNIATNQIEFIFEKNTLTIASEDLDYKKSYRNTVETETETLIKFNIGFNGSFFKKIIDKKTPVTTINLSAPNRAAIVNEDRLIMPVMLYVAHFSEIYANDFIAYFDAKFTTNQDVCLSELNSHFATMDASKKKGYTDKLNSLILDADLKMKSEKTKPEEIPAFQTRKEIHQKFLQIFQQPMANSQQPRNINEKVIFCTIPTANSQEPKPSIPETKKVVEITNEPQQPEESENLTEGFYSELERLLLESYTQSLIDFERAVYNLAGDANKKLRQNFVEHLTGNKMPVAKCGVNHIKQVLTDRFNANSDQPSENIGQLEQPEQPEESPIQEIENTVEITDETEQLPQVFIIKDYTPKSFLVIGNFDAIAEELAKCGRFTRKMRVGEMKVDAYWCSNKRLETVRQIIQNA